MWNKFDAWCDRDPKRANSLFTGLAALLGGYVLMTCLNIGLERLGY